MEWLIDPDGHLWLLQSRPITAADVPGPSSHLFGPGPVAETLPDPLAPLERDLWVPQLDVGLAEALRISGAGPARPEPTGPHSARRGSAPDRRPLVIDVDGRVAIDLEAIGAFTPQRALRFNPVVALRRLRVAWRLGRLRRALPAIAADLAAETDGHLAAVPPMDHLDDDELLAILATTSSTLVGLHAHEVLTGLFLPPEVSGTTSASIALRTLRRDRSDGVDDAEIVARSPSVLALVPPRIGPVPILPPTPEPAPGVPRVWGEPAGTTATPAREEPAGTTLTRTAEHPVAIARETLRLRARWVQELGARAAWELGQRLCTRRQLSSPGDVRRLGIGELRDLVASNDRMVDPGDPAPEPPPLPGAFRLSAGGRVIADRTAAGIGALGVSPGRVRGPVSHDPATAAGSVLVAPSLDPGLAVVLPGLAALVAETGSPLSHLAILAREQGVPVVVGVADATAGLAEGEVVLVDGTVGSVEPDPTATADQKERPV